MARKRSAWERFRYRRRQRLNRRPIPGGWKLTELAALAGISPRTVTDYLGRGLLIAPEFRGTSTRYERDHLVRLMAIQLCKRDGERSLKGIRAKLQPLSSAEIEAWIASRELPPQARAALGLGAAAPAPQAVLVQPPSSQTAHAPAGIAWTRLELLPGLEISVQSGASLLAQNVARHLVEQAERWLLGAVSHGREASPTSLTT